MLAKVLAHIIVGLCCTGLLAFAVWVTKSAQPLFGLVIQLFLHKIINGTHVQTPA